MIYDGFQSPSNSDDDDENIYGYGKMLEVHPLTIDSNDSQWLPSNSNDDDDEEDIYGHGNMLDVHPLTVDSNDLQGMQTIVNF